MSSTSDPSSLSSLSSVGSAIVVVAGVIVERRDGCERALLTQRKKGTHLGGMWEFPGGKVEGEEDPRDALVRELREELGVEVEVGKPIEVTSWRYPEKRVLLLFFETARKAHSPEPHAIDVADLRWVDARELSELSLPPADESVVVWLRARLGP